MNIRIPLAAIVSLVLATTGRAASIDTLGQPFGPVSAQIVGANTNADRELRLLARIEAQPNEVIEFYEPAPGVILVSGAGQPANGSVLGEDGGRGRTPEEIWTQIAGGREMPAALSSALQRRDARPYRRAGAPRVTPARRSSPDGGEAAAIGIDSTEGGTIPQPAGWCDGEYLDSNWGTCADFDFMRCRHHQTATTGASHHDLWLAYANTCAARGSVQFHVWYDDIIDNGEGTWIVPQGSVRWWWFQDQYCKPVPGDDCPRVGSSVRVLRGIPARFHFKFTGMVE